VTKFIKVIHYYTSDKPVIGAGKFWYTTCSECHGNFTRVETKGIETILPG